MTLKDSRNDHGTTKSDPNSPERKQRVSNRARTQKRGARRRPFELQTLRLGRNGGGPKEVTPSTTARIDNNEVLRGCLGGGTYVSQPPRRANRGALKNGGQDTHTHTFNQRSNTIIPTSCPLFPILPSSVPGGILSYVCASPRRIERRDTSLHSSPLPPFSSPSRPHPNFPTPTPTTISSTAGTIWVVVTPALPPYRRRRNDPPATS